MPSVVTNEALPVSDARSGNAQAWHCLFQRYQLPLYSYVFELVRNHQTALDLVQDSFISAVKHIDRLHEDHRFGSWLFSIAHQKCLQLWRKAHHLEPLEDLTADAYVDGQALPDQWLIDQEDAESLYRALEQLPVLQRAVVTLHFIDDFSLEEISEITASPLGTVKSRLHYAKKALRSLIERLEAS
jgi:RNA polymerase sigma-70 factor, ECF subfamily